MKPLATRPRNRKDRGLRGPNGAKRRIPFGRHRAKSEETRSSSRSRCPYAPHEAEGLGFASPATTSGAHRRLQSAGYFNDPSIAAVCFAPRAVIPRGLGQRVKLGFIAGPARTSDCTSGRVGLAEPSQPSDRLLLFAEVQFGPPRYPAAEAQRLADLNLQMLPWHKWATEFSGAGDSALVRVACSQHRSEFASFARSTTHL
jgi:hypothetical protein